VDKYAEVEFDLPEDPDFRDALVQALADEGHGLNFGDPKVLRVAPEQGKPLAALTILGDVRDWLRREGRTDRLPARYRGNKWVVSADGLDPHPGNRPLSRMN
jgi:hypothetical protein